jgi:choline dehydrogenase
MSNISPPNSTYDKADVLFYLGGVTITPSTLNMRSQTRSDSKAGYIDPLPPRDNLVILTGYQVTKVNFNGSTDTSGNIVASGITFASGRGQTSHTVYANKEVILS